MDEDHKQRPTGPTPPAAPWAFMTDNDTATAPDSDAGASVQPDSIQWTASEFIAHQKSAGWYLVLAFSAIILAALTYLISHDLSSATVVIVVAIFLAAIAGHKPRELQYSVNPKGFTVGHRSYTYGMFKSFSIVQEGAFSSVLFMPLKRFMPPVTIYYLPEDESKVVEMLGAYLPLAPVRNDLLDKFLERIRF